MRARRLARVPSSATYTTTPGAGTAYRPRNGLPWRHTAQSARPDRSCHTSLQRPVSLGWLGITRRPGSRLHRGRPCAAYLTTARGIAAPGDGKHRHDQGAHGDYSPHDVSPALRPWTPPNVSADRRKSYRQPGRCWVVYLGCRRRALHLAPLRHGVLLPLQPAWIRPEPRHLQPLLGRPRLTGRVRASRRSSAALPGRAGKARPRLAAGPQIGGQAGSCWGWGGRRRRLTASPAATGGQRRPYWGDALRCPETFGAGGRPDLQPCLGLGLRLGRANRGGRT
jgi:hypothetical protein